jgi:hypothetical protein
MADQLHTVITQFRDSYLTELKDNLYNLFASLESKIRDTLPTSSSTNELQTIKTLLEEMKQNKNVVVQNPITEMKYNPFTSIPPDTKQVTVRNEMPTCVSCTTSIVDCEEPTKFTPLEIDGKTYWLDDDHVVYNETEEGYEQVGSYDPESG